MQPSNLSNTDEIIDYIEEQLKFYYSGITSATDMEGLVVLNSRLATLYWFISKEESQADADLDALKAAKYLEVKQEAEKMTIPDIENKVKVAIHEQAKKRAKLYSAVRSVDRMLTSLAIRIKSLRKDSQ